MLVRTFGGRCWHAVDPAHLGRARVVAECGRDLADAQLVHGEPIERPVCEACRRRLWIRFLGRILPPSHGGDGPQHPRQ